MVATAPFVAADESALPQPAAVEGSKRTLDFGFNGLPGASQDAGLCRGCTTPLGAVSIPAGRAVTYAETFRVDLVESGPLSFGLSGRRLRMEVAF